MPTDTFDVLKGSKVTQMKNFTPQIRKVILSTIAVYLITSIHHIYGARLYSTPWRNHIATQGLTWLVASLLILWTFVKWRRKLLLWLFVLISGFFFIGAIGFFEGGYNHVLKNALYFAGVDQTTLLNMYPPPRYELPNDWLFELSGIFTFIVCMWCLKTYVLMVKDAYHK